jgi:hypothetical protein
MTRHDLSARTVAIRHRPTGSTALIITAPRAPSPDPMKIAATSAQIRHGRLLPDARNTPRPAASAGRLTAAKQKNP